MSKKISEEEFLNRFYRSFPDAEIQLLNYTAISNKLTVKCNKCGKEYKKSRAREFLSSFSCCGSDKNIRKIDKLKEIYKQSDDFDFVKQIDKDHYIVRHNKCGNEFKRVISSSLDNPFACKYCNTIKSNNMISIKEIQDRLDKKFFGEIQILDYNGQLEVNHYKCLKCGLIFIQKHICLMQSRGCPKCDRFKSLGERHIADYLSKKGISFKEQVRFPDLPRQSFDFGIYKNDKLQYLIEVQGEQHFETREIFHDSYDKIHERDERKRSYCKSLNIPLYELIYKKGKIKNLDILPIDSTTISAKESTP